jgi:hypothetical protein
VKSSSSAAVVVAVTLLTAATVRAAHVDFNDPRRALGREDNIKVDAEMMQDTLSSGAPIQVTYQVENLSESTIAIADKVTAATFDADSQTITMTIGAEIPPGQAMPHLTTIAPGQKRSFRAGAAAAIATVNAHGPFAHVPRFVQIVVNVMRDVRPFANLIEMQARSATAPALPNNLFDQWVANVSSVELNTLPVRWSEQKSSMTAEVSRPAGPGRF